MKRTLLRVYSLIPPWAFKVIIAGFGLCLIIFNDAAQGGTEDIFEFLLISYFFVLAFLFAAWVFRQVKSTIRLRKEKTSMEVQHLQSQVNPHFFFNVLNNLYGWVDKDPKVAKDMILNLSDMMRYSIYDGQQDLVTIQEELDYLDKYVNLHRNRYLKNIEISKEINVADPTLKVMPLLFIILLENAFKHGVETLREGSFVKINITTTAKELTFTIANNFDPEAQSETPGVGLKNLKRRLELGYPKQHTLSLEFINDIHLAKLSIQLR
ncbi:MAG: sensor histidine kinase [Saprospiraceae bacterium]